MLQEKQMDGTIRDLEKIAMDRIIISGEYAEKYFHGLSVNISGGKDSSVITDLVLRSKVKIRNFQTAWTGLEYPETVYFLRDEKKRLENLGHKVDFVKHFDKNGKQVTMWSLIERHGLPTRNMRFCCQELKETLGSHQFIVLGIRWAESARRKNDRKIYEMGNRIFMTNSDNDISRKWQEKCYRYHRFMVNPIIDWSNDDVWEYIHKYNLPVNPLYAKGHKRVGCIGCPMRANGEELDSLPKWKALYKNAIKKYLEATNRGGDGIMERVEDFYDFWIKFSKGHYKKPKEITLF